MDYNEYDDNECYEMYVDVACDMYIPVWYEKDDHGCYENGVHTWFAMKIKFVVICMFMLVMIWMFPCIFWCGLMNVMRCMIEMTKIKNKSARPHKEPNVKMKNWKMT